MSTEKYDRSRALSRRKQGLCYNCDKVPENGTTRCSECAERAKENLRHSRERKIAAGICVCCPEPAAQGVLMCQRHLEMAARKAVQAREKRREQGLCLCCGRPSRPNRSTCAHCGAAPARAMYSKESRCRLSLNGNRSVVLERDKFTCQLCGKTPARTIHHIDGSGHSKTNRQPSSKANNAVSNLITLCSPCHHHLEDFLRRPKNIELYLQLLQRKPLD